MINGPIYEALGGKDAKYKKNIYKIMIYLDGTSNLGANAILAVSLSTAKAALDAFV